MSATVCGDSMVISAAESQPGAAKLAAPSEVDFAKCECCGLTEECTQAYIDRIRERYQGKWICGLCAEAVKDEVVRYDRLISTEEALTRHMDFCKSAGTPSNPTVHLISAIRQVLRRTLDSPRAPRSTPSSPKRGDINRSLLARSETCIPTISLVDSSSYHSGNEGNE